MGSMDNISNIENYSNVTRKTAAPSNQNDLAGVNKPKLFNNVTNTNNLNSSLTDLTNLANATNVTNNIGPHTLPEEHEDSNHETKSIIIKTLM